MMASLLGVSFEAFLIDDEMLSHVYRIIRGVEVNEATLGFNAIKDTVYGDGHFLGNMHTMERDHFYPKLSDRIDPRSWETEGKTDMWNRANVRVREILQDYRPEYLSSHADNKLKDKYTLFL